MRAYAEIARHYLRTNRLPHVWCPGCGDGTVLGAFLRAVDELGLDKDKVAVVSGIGCSSRTPVYVDFNTLHTTHGRPLAFATGIKLARPELTVVTITGDGDCLAIGGNHFIHACRRNIDMTVIIYNNSIYGMTGGQHSPTTPEGAFAATIPYGTTEPPFDACKLAEAAGASFVARGTTYHTRELEKLFVAAIKKKGLSVVEVIQQCPTYYGRYNRMRSPVDMLNWQKENTITVTQAQKLDPEQSRGKIVRGILFERDAPELCENYRKLIERAQAKG